VRPLTEVASDASRLDVQVPLPIAVTGKIADPNGKVVKNALVRAYTLYTATEQPTDASTPTAPQAVTQIAETRTDQDGSYVLLLPSTFGN
jgi:protocatechuate 3,4-dioxygenase beta subunit